MLYNRFQFIQRFITFDDKATRGDRWKSDKFACLRELFEMMNEQNSKRCLPLTKLCIHTMDQSTSNNATQANLLSMVYSIVVCVIRQCCTLTITCPMRENQKRTLVNLVSTMSLVQMSTRSTS